MAGVQLGFGDGIAKTPFLAEIDPERCNYCGARLKTCNVRCIGLCRWLPKPADSWRIARAIANGGGEDRSVAEGRGGVGSQGNRASI